METDFPHRYTPDPRTFPDYDARYFELNARFALTEGRKLDALSSYQRLIVNPYYEEQYGTSQIVKRARPLWDELGGTDAGWAVWSRPERPVDGVSVVRRGMPMFPWVALHYPLPEMHLQDANDRTWTLSDFTGKTTFVLIWATWCAPCWRDLPTIQKIHEAVRDRRDVQVVTFSADEDPAIVHKFMAERKYDFNALAAKAYLSQILSGPVVNGQTWVVDSNATVRSQRSGWPFPNEFWITEAIEMLNRAGRINGSQVH